MIPENCSDITCHRGRRIFHTDGRRGIGGSFAPIAMVEDVNGARLEVWPLLRSQAGRGPVIVLPAIYGRQAICDDVL